MGFFGIVWKSLQRHAVSSILAGVSIAVGISLLVAVDSLKEQTHRTFTRVGLGVDAVLAPEGSPLQIVLNALYHLETMPGTIHWHAYETISDHPLVVQAIPFVVGHSYGGFRVNGVDRRFLIDFEYLPGKTFSFDEADGGRGRIFSGPHEAVAGWRAAKALDIRLGDTFHPVCGLHEGDHVHETEHIRFVGITAPTGTPHDRAIYIPLTTVYGLSGHGHETQQMAEHAEHREISGAYLKLRRIRGGAIHPGVQGLTFEINKSDHMQVVVPNEVIPRLFDIIGWVDRVLVLIAAVLTVLSALFLFVSLLSALRERRRDLALLRAVGATRQTVMGLVVVEAVVISFLGGVIGVLLGHGIIAAGAHFIKIETGVRFTAAYLSTADALAIPGAVVLGILAGLIPGLRAYRLGALDAMTPLS